MAQGATALSAGYDAAERIAAEFERVGIESAVEATEAEWLLAASLAGLTGDPDKVVNEVLRQRVAGMFKSRAAVAANGDVFASLMGDGGLF